MTTRECLTDHMAVSYTLTTDRDSQAVTEIHTFTCDYCKVRAVIVETKQVKPLAR